MKAKCRRKRDERNAIHSFGVGNAIVNVFHMEAYIELQLRFKYVYHICVYIYMHYVTNSFRNTIR